MQSIILRTASPVLMALQVLLAIWLFLRGHNQPGGGFVGGLVGASAIVLYTIAFGAEAARNALRLKPHSLIAWGLLIAITSGLFSFFGGENFFSGQWLTLPLLGKIGTPVMFDIGVFSVVLGVVLSMIFALESEGSPIKLEDNDTIEEASRAKITMKVEYKDSKHANPKAKKPSTLKETP